MFNDPEKSRAANIPWDTPGFDLDSKEFQEIKGQRSLAVHVSFVHDQNSICESLSDCKFTCIISFEISTIM